MSTECRVSLEKVNRMRRRFRGVRKAPTESAAAAACGAIPGRGPRRHSRASDLPGSAVIGRWLSPESLFGTPRRPPLSDSDSRRPPAWACCRGICDGSAPWTTARGRPGPSSSRAQTPCGPPLPLAALTSARPVGVAGRSQPMVDGPARPRSTPSTGWSPTRRPPFGTSMASPSPPSRNDRPRTPERRGCRPPLRDKPPASHPPAAAGRERGEWRADRSGSAAIRASPRRLPAGKSDAPFLAPPPFRYRLTRAIRPPRAVFPRLTPDLRPATGGPSMSDADRCPSCGAERPAGRPRGLAPAA